MNTPVATQRYYHSFTNGRAPNILNQPTTIKHNSRNARFIVAYIDCDCVRNKIRMNWMPSLSVISLFFADLIVNRRRRRRWKWNRKAVTSCAWQISQKGQFCTATDIYEHVWREPHTVNTVDSYESHNDSFGFTHKNTVYTGRDWFLTLIEIEHEVVIFVGRGSSIPIM